ncbi:pentapeptide repeat-containing protein [Tersicoccus sp. Bi-70]|uniref:pentapeptide repeat-containing protein n=1 Tax=Tersicoccus sp. Bi-70 TaxID=1897634 RepID=UPI0018E97EF9|nr:pentapeptide repeat-containing protein [Tersicoccus sp. Bi-70]
MAPGRRKLTAPLIEDLHLPDLTDADPVTIRAGGHHEAQRYTDADLSERELADTVFTECAFDGVTAGDADLRGARFLETSVARLTAPVLRASRSTWRDARLAGSRLGAVELDGADLRSVAITGSKLTYVNLRTASLRDVAFTDCVIDELDLTQAEADRVALDGCTVGTLLIDHARLRHVDLRGAELRTISGVDALRGAVLSSAQAADLAEAFAAHLGITVSDEPAPRGPSRSGRGR